MDGVDNAASGGDVVVRLERTGERVLELDLFDGVGCERGLLGEGALVHRGETAGLRKSTDGGGLVEGGGAVEGLVEQRGQQRSEFGGVMLRGEDVGAEGERGGVGGVVGHGFRGRGVDARFGGGSGGKLDQARVGFFGPQEALRGGAEVAVAGVGGWLEPCVDDAQGGVEVTRDLNGMDDGVGVLGDGRREVVAVLFDSAGLVSEERGRVESAARDVDLGEGVVELEVVPEDGGAGQEALRRTGVEFGDAAPVGRSGNEIFAPGAGGLGVKVSERGQTVWAVGCGGEKVLLQRHRAQCGVRLRIKIGKRTIKRDGLVAGVGVRRVEVGDGAEQWSSLLEVGSEDVDLSLFAERSGVRD